MLNEHGERQREERGECANRNYTVRQVWCVVVNIHSRTEPFYTILHYAKVYGGIGNPSTFHRSLQALDLRVRFLRKYSMVGDCSQLMTILCVSLVSPTPPFPRSHHNALQLRVRIFVIGWYRRQRRPGRSIISVYCSSSTSSTVYRGPSVLPDPKSSPAHNQRRFVIFCKKGLTDSRSLNLLGWARTCFVSNL